MATKRASRKPKDMELGNSKDENKIIKNEDGSVTVVLKDPIESVIEKKTITEITIQKLKAKHLYDFNMAKAKMKDFLVVASRASGIHERDIGELSPGDSFAVIGVVSDFF